MFSGKKSRGKSSKKSQETQSPVTKLFKNMCKTSDSSCCAEKENLLKQKKKTKKSQQSQQSQMSCDCPQPPSNCGQQQPPKHQTYEPQDRDDTFSCTSCALKKCLTADPPKLVFLVCVALAFILVAALLDWWSCRSNCSQPTFSDDIMLDEERRERRSDDSMTEDRKPWDASKSKLMSGLSELMEPGNKDPSMHDMSMDRFGNSMPELSSILDPVKVNEAYSSNSLRNFYKKLLKTDVQIKHLKKGFAALKRGSNNDFFDPMPQRAKRSIKVFTGTTRGHFETPSLNKRSLKNLHIFYPPVNGVKSINAIEFDIKEDDEMGAFPDPNSSTRKLKEKNLLRQHTSTHKNKAAKYTPSLVNYKTESYQHEMKHLYNKNSENLDELLAKLLEKQVPQIMLNIEDISDGDESNKFISNTKITDSMKVSKEESGGENPTKFLQANNMKNAITKTTEINKALHQLHENTRYDKYKETTTATKDDETDANMEPIVTEANVPEATSDNFEYMITLAAVLGSPSNKYRKDPTDQRVFIPKLRRLLQLPKNYDEDDDDDDTEAEDYEEQTKEPWDREKRMVKPRDLDRTISTTQIPEMKNPNWKGPMPLYHDELNYMIHAAMKMATDKNAKKLSKEKKWYNQVKSNEYIEDDATADDNYNELVEMAQAYSDYGVLDGKKEPVEKNKVPVNSMSIVSGRHNKILERIKNKVGKPRQLLSQRIKLKSKDELKADTDKIFKKLGLHKRFSKDKLQDAKRDNEDDSTTPTTLFNVVIDKSANYRYPYRIVTDQDSIYAYPKELQNHKERSIYTGFRRSLKSIDIDKSNDDVDDSEIEPKINHEEKLNITTDSNLKTIANDTVLQNKSGQMTSIVFNKTGHRDNSNISTNFKENIAKLTNDSLHYNNSKTPFGLGDIFGMIADFCLFLAGFDTEEEKSDFRSVPDFIAVLKQSALQIENKTTTRKFNNDTRAPVTGYRSRILLSLEEQIDNVTSCDKEGTSESYTNTENIDISINNNTETSMHNLNELNETDNITVVKRSANGNLLTWNDLYDDEYGVKDKLDNDMKEKSNDKYNEFLAKSETWLENKFKQIANTVKNKKKLWDARKNATRNKPKTLLKRSLSKSNKDSGKQTFEALTANMKKVFHEAAAAIQDTTNREARSDSEQASTLMQQLVALMSELVDIQVRQKTCVQLPEDLRSFLVWLTTPNPQERNDFNLAIEPTYDTDPTTKNYLNIDTFELMSPNTRNDCLGTIHDVEDLIQQYDDMSEDDKSKMSGVREYLEHQLDFLHKQLSNFNEFGFPVMYQEHAIRRRRQLPTRLNDKLRQRKANRFIKYFGRKRTRSTSYDEQPTEAYNSVQRKNDEVKKNRNKSNDKKAHGKAEPKNGHFAIVNKDVNDNEGTVNKVLENTKKRNLQDVYYSPLGRTNATTVKYGRV